MGGSIDGDSGSGLILGGVFLFVVAPLRVRADKALMHIYRMLVAIILGLSFFCEIRSRKLSTACSQQKRYFAIYLLSSKLIWYSFFDLGVPTHVHGGCFDPLVLEYLRNVDKSISCKRKHESPNALIFLSKQFWASENLAVFQTECPIYSYFFSDTCIFE